jgi:transposase
MLADHVEFIIGVDTHKHRHTAALVTANGGLLASLAVPATAAGYRRLLNWAEEQANAPRAWAIEGTASYGAGLSSFLQDRSEWVIEIDRPTRAPRGKVGAKSDAIDALRAAREALSREAFATPRQRGLREAMRALQTTREGITKARTKSLNQLHALVVAAPEELRGTLRPFSTNELVRRCARLRVSANRDLEWRTYVDLLRRTALRVLALETEAEAYQKQISQLTQRMAPELCVEAGVGPSSAALILITWSHPGRVASEAAFASMAGAAPIEASSGQHTRHRLNRGGDRQLNRALHTVAENRMRHHEATREYVQRRRREGMTDREIRRCLKRYLARHFFKLLRRSGGDDERMFRGRTEVAA